MADLKETWEEIETNIDFCKYRPISTGGSLHIYEERYCVNGKTYRLLYPIGYEAAPIVQILL